ncbi:MAG: DUF485 domain-containing protein [Pseudonocardia sp.]|nr:DUF485 domain-containing protein [Pseudonocardia sp.]
MSTTDNPHDDRAESPPDSHERYGRIYQSAEFASLRSRFRRFVFPATVAFLVWYFLYVLMATFAPGFMGVKVLGNINVAIVFGLLQFVTTFLLAWWYANKAKREFDPAGDRLRHEFEEGAR